MEENKNTIIIVSVVCVLLVVIGVATRGCGNKEEKRVIVAPQNFNKKIDKNEKISEMKTTYSRGYSGGGSSADAPSGPPPLYTEDELKKRSKKIKERKARIAKLKKEYIEKKLSDPSLSPEAIEQLKLRSNPSFFSGMKAFKNKDYKEAGKGFAEVLNDKDATPVSKYFAAWNLMEVAKETGNFELFFIAAKTRASLISKEDLSMLGYEKSDEEMENIKYIEKILKAKMDSNQYRECLKEKLSEFEDITDEYIEMAKEELDEDVEYYSSIYKELIK